MDHEAFVRGEGWISQPDCTEAVNTARLRLATVWGWTTDPWYTTDTILKELSLFVQDQLGLAEEFDAAVDDDRKVAWIEHVAQLKQPAPVPEEEPEGPALTELTEPTERVQLSEATTEEQPPREQPPEATAEPVKQSLFGNKPRPVTAPVPTYTGGQPGMEKLLEGVLEKSTIDEAIAQMYSNLRNNMGLHYVAASLPAPGPITRGEKNEGMCETFRNVLFAGVKEYDALRKTHPVDAVKNGALTYKINNSLNMTKFVTNPGLTLIGGLEGNVMLEVDGMGGLLNEGYDAINRFVFSGHWTIEINGRVYDPIFESIDGDNVGIRLDVNRIGDDSRFLGVPQATPGNEFAGSFIWVHGWAKFSATVAAMRDLYTKNRKDIDRALAGKGSPGKVSARAKEVVAKGVAEDDTFRRVVRLSVSTTNPPQFSADDLAAVEKVIDLALLDAE